ncbi:hydroxyacid-oxoacid transhydrogenase [Chondromyces apiculatus]|uniref:hydroxyacid-oxoacid transhydrogenase n=1 Tax=Chondromyces apiculatus DSM 436 TaxID=1192034 RepID=A0A017TFK1_9BACT|nr:hydroxyacid-oxoacid transhydrogenase [Chondromyces apiculatus]EYF08033.1 Alcohol dehydrogenase [Chondromyces apiculatus DSM 436]
MGSCLGYALLDGCDAAFSIDASSVTFGRGALSEIGEHARALGARRVALFTDRTLAALPPVDTARRALLAAGLDVAVYDDVRVEPTDASFLDAAAFAREGGFDTYVSVGGGSVIDTCKAALLYATYPADLAAYVNRPLGEGRPVPGPLPPHLACPTTTGTGSECTGIAIFDFRAHHAKTGIASRALRPTLALVDPTAAASLPAGVVAASGFDVLSHALESFTARPFSARARPDSPRARPMSQGRNPWSDLGCREALRLTGRYLVRAARDAADTEARDAMAWAATLAGIAFGNAGVHLPHAMSYALSGLRHDFHMPGYPAPFVPHGVAVILGAPAAFRALAATDPARHLEAATLLGADPADLRASAADPRAIGDLLADHLARMMQDAGLPNGASAVGYGEPDLRDLAAGTLAQARLIDNAPRPIAEDELTALFRSALTCW